MDHGFTCRRGDRLGTLRKTRNRSFPRPLNQWPSMSSKPPVCCKCRRLDPVPLRLLVLRLTRGGGGGGGGGKGTEFGK